ncbi:ABC transporter substrate-binding protein [Bradyrhizobium sp. U87765 SZCCT0131]|nr:ABC transporter substrate-binding protein [Bradyrhizobium sp. U87765 SZCCT0131]MBR1263378.1 ABC transporter substrate-binding protein [Bradyrhizobium sp. U87765 SZCCT0134]MBR1306739.1 ABC transporter substrate-binding protein [Bradyrhizobium sp. U87765 SZCCT0110]MBR1323238.1 ABC transporter substrate-binding protein [Bradyrhizobium sp. U87765 SZCCT0109]MBR1345693.1 ABC transporter substrate-binding protein [Bradyrhizobium sp. U87765 SZCCT0048]
MTESNEAFGRALRRAGRCLRGVGRMAAGLVCVAASAAIAAPESAPAPTIGIAMHGAPALAPDVDHMPYVNPAAPKGGRLTFGILGTFDSLNPLIVKGLAVQQIRGYVIESLLTRGQNEPFTLYGLLADRIETDDARSFVTFHLNARARFADGRPVLAEDVLFSWELLRDHGRPNHRLYYAKVAKAEALDPRTVRFVFDDAGDRELPLILGLMPVLPRHALDPARFEDTSLAPPLGSGPYRVSEVNPGTRVVFKRNPDYWGRDLAVNRGLWNFDEVRLDYYREANGAFEAFKRGLYDFRVETDPLRWHEGYDFPAARRGDVVRSEIRTGLPKPSEFLVFNTRRPIFADRRVRQALTLLFDFEWINRNYFFGLYTRSGGFFAGSDLSAYGQPADARERALLAPHGAALLPEILDGGWRLPVSDGSGRDRDTLRSALTLLEDAGYELDGTTLRDKATRTAFGFEFLVTTREQERIALAFARDVKRAGIVLSVRVVDAVQYDQRKLAYDFDMIQNRWDQSLSPGNEQSFYWGSAAADNPGTRNYMGAKEPAVDAMIGALLEARTRPSLVSAVRALDRVLMSGFYAIPLYNADRQWIARWNRIQQPPTNALSGYLPETWWQRPTAAGQ